MSELRKCLCCGAEYRYCPTCGRYAREPKWRVEFDTLDCKEVFNAISGYNMGIRSIESLKEVLDNNNVTDFSKYKDSIKNKLNELFPNEKPKKKTRKKKLDIDLENNTETVE